VNKQPPKLDTDSKDIMSENLRALKELFPSVIKDGSLDVEALKNLIGDISEPNTEYYNFTWAGKSDAFKIIKEKSKATLKPLKSDDESLNFENTGNIFIEGDNLEVLKILQKTYHNAIKMIYIDPPYNKDKDFVYPDRWSEGLESYLEYAKLVDEDGNITSSSAEEQSVKQGRKHSRWLTMMYPRLFLARNLLKDDGVIFISIDDDEVKNLKMICDEIFGEENFVGFVPTIMNLKGNADAYGFSAAHEYTLVYSKNKEACELNQFQLDEDEIFNEWLEDEYGLYKKADTLRRTGQDASRERRPKGWFPVFITQDNHVYVTSDDEPKSSDDTVLYPVNEDNEELSWSWGKNKITNEPHNLIVINGRNGKNIYKKQRPQLGDIPTKKPKSFFYKSEYSTSTATTKLREVFGKKIFDSPKPAPLIKDLIIIGSSENDIVLDFFAGSGTTAQAMMELNSELIENRKFILVQLPEHLDKKNQKEAIEFLTDIKKSTNIAEITKERIRRAGRKIKEENPDTTIDTGFKVFKLSESNFKKWDENIQTKEQLKVSLDLFANNVKKRAKPLDMLYEVILSKGLSLNSTIDEVTIGGKSMYKVNSDGVELLACFEDEITKTALDEVVSLRPIYFICLDSSFKNDTSLKTNSVLNFKDADILFETV
jgi:adenine-specific DNA-methyltransferase